MKVISYEKNPSFLISKANWEVHAARAKVQPGFSAQEGIVCLKAKYGGGGLGRLERLMVEGQ